MEAENNDKRTALANSTDEELMLYLSMGTQEEIQQAKRIFYERFFPYLVALSKKILKSRYSAKFEAQDLAALCLVRVFDKADKYDPEKGAVKAWIGRILENLIKVTMRDADRKELTIAGSLNDPDYRLLEEDIMKDDCPDEERLLRKQLDACLGKLKEQDRTILLEFYEEKDVSNMNAKNDHGVTQEIADRHGITQVNVRQKVYRAMNKLKQCLGK